MKELIVNVFDTETTGLLKPKCNDLDKQPYITEIYVAKLIHRTDGVIEQIDEFEQMFKPGVPLTAEITRITGITNDDVKDCPSFKRMAGDFCNFFVGVHRMVAHNLAFDRGMIVNELARAGKVMNFPFPPQHICTVEKSMHIEQRRMSLTRLHEEFFGEGFPDAHRAKSDVIPLVRCYKHMVKEGMIL
jgi:DNA polymerase III epsilon subunit-like protein